MRDGVEIRLEVCIDDVSVTLTQQRVHPTQRILGTTLRAKAIAVRRKRYIEDRFQYQTQGGLHDAVPHRWNPQRAPHTRSLRNPVPPNRLRTVCSVSQRSRQRSEVRLESRLIHRDRHMIHTSSATIRPHTRKGGSQHRQSPDLVHQRVPSPSSDALFERRQHPFRPHLRGRPRPPGASCADATSPIGHCRQLESLRCIRHGFLFLRPFARRPFWRVVATMSALTPAQAALRLA